MPDPMTATAVRPVSTRAFGVPALRHVALPVTSGYQKGLAAPTDPAVLRGGNVTVGVDTDAIAALGRAGADLSVPRLRFSRQVFTNAEVSVRAEGAAQPIDPAVGALKLKLQVTDTMRSPMPAHLVDWTTPIGGEFGGYTFADLAVVWDRPGAAPLELVTFRSNAGMVGGLSFSLRELLAAACRALGEAEPVSVAASLPDGELRQAIATAALDGAIDAAETRDILARGEQGGIAPNKVKLVQALYENTPSVSWRGAGIAGQGPVLEHQGATQVRAFLLRHHALGGNSLVEQERAIAARHPLPRPPENPEHALAYVSWGSPDYNIPHQSPLLFTAARDQLWVEGRGGSLTVSTPGGTIEFNAPAGVLREGETYGGGPRIVSGGRGGGGYVMSEGGGGRFKVHALERDPADGTVRKAVLSWVSVMSGGFGADLGICPGHLVYEHAPLAPQIASDVTYQALVAALNDRGRYDATPLLKILSAKGYVDDADRALLRELRREHGLGLTARVDVALLGIINSSGPRPLVASGEHPTAQLKAHLHWCEAQGRTAEQMEPSRELIARALVSLRAAQCAGYALTDDDQQALTRLATHPLAVTWAATITAPLVALGIVVLPPAQHTPLAAACVNADPVGVRAAVEAGADLNSQVLAAPVTVTLLERCRALRAPLTQQAHRALAWLVAHPALALASTQGLAQRIAHLHDDPLLASYGAALLRRARGETAPVVGTVLWRSADAADTVSFDGNALYRNGMRVPTPPKVDLGNTLVVVEGDLIGFLPADARLPRGSVPIGSPALLGGQGLVTYSPRFDSWGKNIYWRFNAGAKPDTVDSAPPVFLSRAPGAPQVPRFYPGDTLTF